MVDPGYLVYVRGILLPSCMGILICHCKDPCKLISTMESQKGFERCSSVNSSNQFWPNNTQWCFQILNPLRYMSYPFPKNGWHYLFPISNIKISQMFNVQGFAPQPTSAYFSTICGRNTVRHDLHPQHNTSTSGTGQSPWV